MTKFRSSRKCYVKKLFLEISQNSQEKTFTEVSFYRAIDLRCFHVNSEKFKNT